MRSWKDTLVDQSATIREVIQTIDTAGLQIAVVVDQDFHLFGTITDGDIRRGILKGVSLDDSLELILNRHPEIASASEPQETILARMKNTTLHQIPIVDEQGRLIRIDTLDDLIQPNLCENWVAIMAGGVGKRLHPLTENCPKPLLKIGSKPLLETILNGFKKYGFHKFFLAVNYKAEMIQDYFGDGSQLDIEIKYIHEKKTMGTAGALSLLPKLSHPLIVMNGDLLTTINFKHLIDFHKEYQSSATMCVREYDFEIPYGVVQTDGHRVLKIEEKPIQRFFINAGIYVLQPSTLNMIPPNTYFDMPSLFQKVIDQGLENAVFPIREYWLDVGRVDDFQKANGEFKEIFT